MPPKLHAALVTLLLAIAAPASAAAQNVASDADACLTRPTVTCSVTMALTASAASDENAERARLVIRAGARQTDLAARKVWLDAMAARFFTDATTGQKILDRERRVIDIAAAITAGDTATANRLLGDTKANFQRWWETLAAVIDAVADAGKPDLAIAFEAAQRRTVTVSKTDALGRKLGNETWDTRQPLTRALVRCGCGPDPLSLALALPKQSDRVGLAAALYARRHDVGRLTALLTREFGELAKVTDNTQRDWIGYGFGTLLRELPVSDIPAALRKTPPWLSAVHFKRPAETGMPGHPNIYGDVLARAVEAGDRKAVAALAKLRPRGDTVWLSGKAIASLDTAAKVEDALPAPERNYLRMQAIGAKLAQGDARKGVSEAMKTPAARGWRKPRLDNEDSAEFEEIVLAPLLARGAFDVAEDAVRQLRDGEIREALQESIATAKAKRPAPPKTAATILAAQWEAYRTSKAGRDAGRTFLFAVRDLLATRPDAFPFE
jgi:hypothetical protein